MHVYRGPMHIMDIDVGAFCAAVEIFISVVYNITIVLKKRSSDLHRSCDRCPARQHYTV